MTDYLETELKFIVADFEPLRRQIARLGGRCTALEHFERNVRYETADDRLRQNHCLLRLRQDRHARLTFKSPPDNPDPRFKSYCEKEVRVSDFDTMDAILQALGFLPRQVYEKRRETWQLDSAELCLDTMPFGPVLEIEAPAEAMLAAIEALELDWPQRIRTSYLEIFAALEKRCKLAFNDLTFENFAGVEVTLADHRRLFEAGPCADSTNPDR